MEAYEVLKDLAIILFFAKVFGILARKCRAPQVVGQILAGLLIGPCVLGWVGQTDFIAQMAERCICPHDLRCSVIYGILRSFSLGNRGIL